MNFISNVLTNYEEFNDFKRKFIYAMMKKSKFYIDDFKRVDDGEISA